MTDYNDKLVEVLQSIHNLEVKVIGEIAVVRSEITALKKESEATFEALKASLDTAIDTDTHRLNKHSEELDTHRTQIAKLEEWKHQFEKSMSNKLVIWQSITAVVAAVIGFLFSKFM